ncbi:hypothetical protein L1077_14830 [Pseudoalteromonas luteoviolacea]|uniref:hypothetical protein n=1 Tax=Pseudoalteromonas luteoviolacea TaxID=43657 RepID=UPI001F482F48|nr:hypothetical protein [Pseudoalteromonas luteoviolacea]MCF6440708.1 hypothetical protein [Pseudoalteromonas luteoviolacea]
MMIKNILALVLTFSFIFSASALSSDKEAANASYKVCHYKLTSAKSNSTYPSWEKKTVRPWQVCPPSWTVAAPNSKITVGIYVYLFTTYR